MNPVSFEVFQNHIHAAADNFPQVIRIIYGLGEVVQTTRTGATSTVDVTTRNPAFLRLVFDKPIPGPNFWLCIWRYSKKTRDRSKHWGYGDMPVGAMMTRRDRIDAAFRPIGIQSGQTGGFPTIPLAEGLTFYDIPADNAWDALYHPPYMRGSVTSKYQAVGVDKYAARCLLKFGVQHVTGPTPTRGHMSRDTLELFRNWTRVNMGTPNEWEGQTRHIRIY